LKNDKNYKDVLKVSKRGSDWNSQKAIFEKIFKAIKDGSGALGTFLDLTCGVGAIFKKLVDDFQFKKWIGLEISECCLEEWELLKEKYKDQVEIETLLMSCFDYRSEDPIQIAYLSFNTFSLHKKHEETWSKIETFLKNNDIEHFVFADTASMWFKIRGHGGPYDVEDWDEYVEKMEDTLSEITNHSYELQLAERFSSKKCAIFHFKKV